MVSKLSATEELLNAQRFILALQMNRVYSIYSNLSVVVSRHANAGRSPAVELSQEALAEKKKTRK